MMRAAQIYVNSFKALSVVAFMLWFATGQAQEKQRVRLAATYTNMMQGPSFLDIQATARIDRSTISLSGIDLEIYYEIDGEEFSLGQVQTNPDGRARYSLADKVNIQPDSSGLYILGASFGGSDTLRRASRTVEFRDAEIRASLQEIDSVYHIVASLRDVASDSLVADALMGVQVQRMFRPLKISEEFLMTDDAGSISVPIPSDIPGKDGNLTLEVVVEDSDAYGTVKALLEAPVGVPIVADTNYEQRALWAPSSRTPIFILLFTGVLIIGSWGLIFYLIFILFKIAKS
jgi:hypothetical protein